MHSAKSILNMTVVNLASGEHFGRVQDLIVDPGQRRVMALLLQPRGRGLFRPRRAALYEGIRHIGRDAVVVADASFVAHANRDPHLRPVLRNDVVILGKPVMSEGGHLLGIIEDMLFDDETGRVHGYVMRSLALKGLPRGFTPVLPADELLVVGRHLAMVSSRAGELLRQEVENAKLAEREEGHARVGLSFWRRWRRSPTAAEGTQGATTQVAVATVGDAMISSPVSGGSREPEAHAADGGLAA